jgi:hypothetical protein
LVKKKIFVDGNDASFLDRRDALKYGEYLVPNRASNLDVTSTDEA